MLPNNICTFDHQTKTKDMKTTYKFHLAKQNGFKEDRLYSQCGKNGNSHGALRVVPKHEFFQYEEENQCLVCLGIAKDLGIGYTAKYIDQD